jgi:protein gp37
VSAKTAITWTDSTFNAWWGCVEVSPGCTNCYARTFAKRVGQRVWGPDAPRRFFGEKHWTEPLKWNRAAAAAGVRRRVFCSSMADVFEDRRDLDPWRARLWTLIEQTPHLDWQLLTKRPENILRLASRTWVWGSTARWPANVWLGTTAEDQQRAEARIPRLLATPAAVRFVSAEPLLGPVVFKQQNPDGFWPPKAPQPDVAWLRHKDWVDDWEYWSTGLDWIIVGGESGPGARPFDVAWARSIVAQCRAAGVAVFVKQLGAAPEEPGKLTHRACARGKGDRARARSLTGISSSGCSPSTPT